MAELFLTVWLLFEIFVIELELLVIWPSSLSSSFKAARLFIISSFLKIELFLLPLEKFEMLEIEVDEEIVDILRWSSDILASFKPDRNDSSKEQSYLQISEEVLNFLGTY